MVSRITRHLVGMIFWTAVAGLFAAITVQVILANYVASKAAFDFLGFEPRPLWSDELVGVVIGAFFPDATLAHLYALAMALTVAGAYFLVFHLAFHIHDLVGDRRLYLGANDTNSARLVTRHIVFNAVLLLALGTLLVGATHWEIDLFRYRSVVGALGIEDPQAAAMAVKSWDLQLQEHGDLFAWSMARWGAWGYLAVTALACLGLEVAFRKIGDKWDGFCGTVGEVFTPAARIEDEPVFYGYDEYGLPVYDPAIPLSFDVDGNPLWEEAAGDAETKPPAEVVQSEVSTPAAPPASGNGTATSNGNGASDAPPTFGALFDSPAAEAQPVQASKPSAAGEAAPPERPAAEPELYDVHGGESGERVSIEEALADTARFYVDRANRRVWRRDHWEQLHGTSNPFDHAGEAQAA